MSLFEWEQNVDAYHSAEPLRNPFLSSRFHLSLTTNYFDTDGL